jgi:hypothetical protein
MNDMDQGASVGRGRRVVRALFGGTMGFFEGLVVALEEYARLMRKEMELFLGTLFLIVGALNFDSGKYCDGNTADYLSCTRPAVYYYFDALDVVLVVLGVFLLLLWRVKNRGE